MMRRVQGFLGLTLLIALPFCITLFSLLSFRRRSSHKIDIQCGVNAPQGQEVCPLGLCCSRYGYCGSSASHCGLGCQSNCTPKNQKIAACNNVTTTRNIAYYESWASKRPCDAYFPNEIDPTPWTHVNFAFAWVSQLGSIVLSSANDTILYDQIRELRKKKTDLELYIAIGGYAVGSTPFSTLAATWTGRNSFITSACSFTDKYGFDGVDIDWEYPADVESGGTKDDTINFVSLVKEFRQQCPSKGLTVTVPGGLYFIKGFDLKGLSPYVDWFNVMEYDLHGSWEKPSIARSHTSLTDISQSLNSFWDQDIDPEQVVLGLAYYGHTFTLENDSCTRPGCPATGPGRAGACSLDAGSLIYAEIDSIIANYSIQPSIDRDAAVKYFSWDETQWVSYDDAETIALKKSWATKNCLGGTMVWAIDMTATTDSTDSST